MDVAFALVAFFALVASWFVLPAAPRALPKPVAAHPAPESLSQAA